MRKALIFTIIVFTLSAASHADAQKIRSKDDWMAKYDHASFWDRAKLIHVISELPEPLQTELVPELIKMLGSKDRSIRLASASELAELGKKSESAIPDLVDKFFVKNEEEGAAYSNAVASFGKASIPYLYDALLTEDRLVRDRACNAMAKVEPDRFKPGDCFYGKISREECDALDGEWGRFGLFEQDLCRLPAPDAGNACIDSSNCVSSCVTGDKVSAGTKVVGKCYEKTITLGKCLNIVKGGKAQGVICED